MEVRVRERLVGALVLVAVVVLLVPAILKGRAPEPVAAKAFSSPAIFDPLSANDDDDIFNM